MVSDLIRDERVLPSAMPDDDHSAISAADAKRLFADWKAVPAIVLAGSPEACIRCARAALVASKAPWAANRSAACPSRITNLAVRAHANVKAVRFVGDLAILAALTELISTSERSFGGVVALS